MPTEQGRRHGYALGLALVVIVALAYTLVLSQVPPASQAAFSAVALVIAQGTGAGLMAMCARRAIPGDRLVWGLLAASAGSSSLIFVVWTFYEIARDAHPPFPSLADVAFIAAVLFVVPAVLRLPGTPLSRGGRTRFGLDGAIVALSFLLISWVTVLGPAYEARPSGIVDTLLILAYPALDTVSIIVVALALLRAPTHARPAVLLIGLGILALGIGDGIFSYVGLKGGNPFGHPLTSFWIVGYLSMAVAAVHSPPLRAADNSYDGTSGRAAVLPIIPPLLALVLAVATEPTAFVVAAAVTLVGLVLARQYVAVSTERRMLLTLENIVAERTAELSDTVVQLAETRDLAVEASRLKSEFLATMSHEVRTPMNGVIGLTSLLLETDLDPTQRQYADGVRNAGEALLIIINDILDFSKIEAGRLVIERVDFDPTEVVEEVAALLSGVAERKGIELLSDIDPALPSLVNGDVLRFRQVLVNLLSNALKFTEVGEVTVRVAHVERRDQKPRLLVEIEDTGIGIPMEARERLFQPFSQADASTTRQFGGTGLGLAISARLVEAMGGQLGYSSVEGEGSTFWFDVPLEPAALVDERPTPRENLAGMRVLVVDDNDTNRLILERQLQAWRVTATAVDGPQAVETLRKAVAAGAHFDAVLLDFNMPTKDGLQLAKEISLDPAISGVRRILLTSGGDVDAATAAAVGIEARLTKPARLSQLHDAIAGGATTGASCPHPVREVDLPRMGSVLVVEDNPTNQLVAQGMLERLGYTVDFASNGKEALRRLSGVTPSIVLMDVHMPEMDGYEATAAIRGGATLDASVPIVAMTANALPGDRQRCLESGMDDYVAKPIVAEELKEVLARWGDRRRLRSAVDESGADLGAASSEEDPLRQWPRLYALGNPELVGAIAAIFRRESLEHLARIQTALIADDRPGAEGAAHALAGSASMIGADRLSTMFRAIEEHLRSGDAGAAAAAVSDARRELESVREALAAFAQVAPS